MTETNNLYNQAIMTNSEQLLTSYYETHRDGICSYIARRIPRSYMAEDLAQDVFVRLWGVRETICEETIKSFVFTVASNIVTDHLRKYMLGSRLADYLIYNGESQSDCMEARINADDLAEVELKIVTSMPPRRRKVYMLSRFDGMSVGDIATQLHLSLRTVEAHLYVGRRQMRTQMRRCI